MTNSVTLRQRASTFLGFLILILGSGIGQEQAHPRIFKISVLASGTVLLDGKPIAMNDLAVVLNGAHNGDTVWYYRESSASEPPPQAKEVIALILKNHLSLSFSTKPDFSDYVDSNGVSHLRTSEENVPLLFTPRMAEVQPVPDIEKLFADVRKLAARPEQPRGMVMVLPDRKFGIWPESRAPQSPSAVERIELIVPSSIKRNIAVIAYTGFAQETFPATSAIDGNKAIPFLGILFGLSYIGHSVWIFEGHPTALVAGCRDADLLIVDSAMLPFLPTGWEDEAAKVMRNPNIMVHDRTIYKLRVVRKVGTTDRLEFRN